MRRRHSSTGTTLVEVLVAMLVLITGVLSMAQMFVLAAVTNVQSMRTTLATVAAAQKTDELRALAWGFDADGLPVSDAALNPSPGETLARNLSGWVDHIDANGHVVGDDANPPVGAAYTRRWSITSLATDADTLVIRVVVMRSERSTEASSRWGDARLLTIRARKRP